LRTLQRKKSGNVKIQHYCSCFAVKIMKLRRDTFWDFIDTFTITSCGNMPLSFHFCLCLARCNSCRTSKRNFMKFSNVFTEFCGHIPMLQSHDNGPECLQVLQFYTRCLSNVAQYFLNIYRKEFCFKKGYFEK
jgi:hypothetical protein